MCEENIKKALTKVSSDSMLIGVVIGWLFGMAPGFALGYDFASDTIIVIPLSEGTKV